MVVYDHVRDYAFRQCGVAVSGFCIDHRNEAVLSGTKALNRAQIHPQIHAQGSVFSPPHGSAGGNGTGDLNHLFATFRRAAAAASGSGAGLSRIRMTRLFAPRRKASNSPTFFLFRGDMLVGPVAVEHLGIPIATAMGATSRARNLLRDLGAMRLNPFLLRIAGDFRAGTSRTYPTNDIPGYDRSEAGAKDVVWHREVMHRLYCRHGVPPVNCSRDQSVGQGRTPAISADARSRTSPTGTMSGSIRRMLRRTSSIVSPRLSSTSNCRTFGRSNSAGSSTETATKRSHASISSIKYAVVVLPEPEGRRSTTPCNPLMLS